MKYNPANDTPFAFKVGDKVNKKTGDYTFSGVVIATMRKSSGSPRYAVENDAGIIHIFEHTQLNKKEEEKKPKAIAYSSEEGGKWQDFPKGVRAFRVFGLKFSDGWTWNSIAGWRKE